MSRLYRNYSILFFIISCMFFVSISYAENVSIYGCYKKNNGQLRVVESWNECLKSEVPISWAAQKNDIVDYLEVFVNVMIGLDENGYGLSEVKPFKTIGYALSRIPHLRSNSEIRTVVYVSSGTYNESLNISINKLWLKGESSGNTFIIGDGIKNVISISGSATGKISDFSIYNGAIGISCTASSITIQDSIIKGNQGYSGLLIQNNSNVYLYKTQIFTNTGHGVSVTRNSTLTMNNCDLYDNVMNGLEVWYTSMARVDSCQLSKNLNNGIQVGGGSSLRLTKSYIFDNFYSGIDSTSNSTALLRGGNEIKGNNISLVEWRGGVGVHQGSEFSITNDFNDTPDQIIKNHENGIYLSNNSTSLIKEANISDNFGDGIDLNFGCSGAFEDLVDISGNQGWGILCSDAILRNTSQVYNNVDGQIRDCP